MSASSIDVEQLEAMLETLGLDAVHRDLEGLLQEAAAQQWSYRELLARACDRQLHQLQERRVEMGLKLGHFPFVRTLQDYDFEAQPGVDRRRVQELGLCRWVERAENVLLLGPPGVGKTHLSVALGHASLVRGHRVVFRTVLEVVRELQQAEQAGQLERALKVLTRPRLLILDELGYLPFERTAAYLLFQLVTRRYEKGSVILTSNRSVEEWGEVLGDTVVATAILDRLLHHSHILTIRGESYRLREKRRAGLLKNTASTQVGIPST